MEKVLVVEDDRTLLSVLEYNLSKEGYAVVTASDGAGGLDAARREKPDFIILDLMLPKMSGYEVCRILRNEMSVPILILSARGEEADKVVGLDLGADDYMTKPFSMRELLARVRAGLRRGGTQVHEQEQATVLKGGDIEIDLGRHMASLRGSPLTLTPKEFDLLAFFLRNQGLVFSRDQLLEKIWGYDYAGDTRTVDVHVRWLREKIETDPGKPRHLVTVRGVGYRLEV
jgi:two-component system OmpR family response regulator